ncbi:MAG: tRNA (guanosine(46)-N7)-methyltransferase TrmB [Halorhodospira halophila]|uniref:tRNA (guanosine(46)-N7)-methyltransferase TrmB n=1 Tax=Halorhodospira TaxID=85108 RepID=UPI001911CED4|nr:tRNA (guanosine(46)-N7)-methyltransferase TrmB [Halorhodospira halophila]MCG5538590.1 tRNA (guanosine(46)-N7)-methyltransferase TrmB [Halorhodospira sp. 9622]MCG5543494.1 tRNA (guanosine(46)-N7)-methyltransferase TrmB [Halorhodospira sp. 9628]MBK5937084.1 tRNA (guanosine(46)-N7)-methyltransferase TrmB [Halorhodospira halophila]MCC3751110.1 tRNA (guanosine(46)-N7)-methyltransferase TrmB [Halorhodospira halophila]MCG5527162.1 tRNA (guanosine(46)-N7)-methyltransferase TrmB [Halorhodospira halo
MSQLRLTRTFVRREGRLTQGQQRALEQLWPGFGIDVPEQGVLDLDGLFGRTAPRVLDIGFGDGEALVEMAAADPGRDYLGVEVHRPGVGHCLLCAEQAQVENLRVATVDAVELVRHHLPPRSLAAVHIFFPDPWPKKRHHKRRIVQPAFLDLLAERLVPGGTLHLATDWADYAEWMLDTVEPDERFENTCGPRAFIPPPPPRPQTKFERRGLRKGHQVHDLIYRLRPADAG